MTMDENEKIREQLSAYLDGELDDAEAGRVEQVVGADRKLAVELEQLRGVRSLLRGLPTERAPKGFVDTVLSQAERPRLVGGADGHPGNRAIQWVRHLATAAVLLVAVSVGAVVVATLWKTSDFDYDPADIGHPSGPVAMTPLKHDMTPEPEKGNRGGAIVHGKGGLRGIREGGSSTFKNGRGDVDGDVPKASGTDTLKALVAKDAYGRAAGGDIAGVQVALNEDIFTSNIPAAAKEVELLFISNGLVPDRPAAVTNGSARRTRGYAKSTYEEKDGAVAVRSQRSNSFLIRNDTTKQRQWVVVAELAQAKRIVEGLKVVRANQDVVQFASGTKRPESGLPDGKAAGGPVTKALNGVRDETKLKGGRSAPGKRDAPDSTVVVGDVRQQTDSKIETLAEGAAGEQEEQAVIGLGGNRKIRIAETPGGSQDKLQKKSPAPAPVRAPADKPGVAAAKPATSPARAVPMKLQRLVITLNFRLPVPAASKAATAEGMGEIADMKNAPATQPADANKAAAAATRAADPATK